MDCVRSEWHGFERLDFIFEDRKATLVCPKEPVDGNKWLYKIEYFESFPAFEIDMLQRGYYVAGLSNISRLCPAQDTDIRPRFCRFLSQEFGLHQKCLPVGLSCGGMQAVYFAAKYPQYVAALYLDAPVLNLLSWPLGLGVSQHPCVKEFEKNIGIPVAEMLNYREHPIDQKEKLLKANIPIFLVCGGQDTVVPYEENGKILSDYYRENGGILVEVVKHACDHHPHGLQEHTALVDFVSRVY